MSIHSTEPHGALTAAANFLALGAGASLLVYAASRRSRSTAWMAAAAVPLFYRGISGHWPNRMSMFLRSDDTKSALAGDRGIHVKEAVRIEKPIDEVYAFWRRFENLPRFMRHLESVTEVSAGRSRWVASGPAGLKVEWDAELINEVRNKLIGWRSLAGSDVVTAGSVNFDEIPGHGTQVTVVLQYAPPAGRAGSLIARLFGAGPAQSIREDLQRLKQTLEAGEIARAKPLEEK